jgi:hypothetical protein
MRSLFAALVVLGLSVLLLARSVSAEPPPPMEGRDVQKIIEGLKKKPALKTEIASVRFAAEVLGQKSLQVPMGSTPETLGPWGDNGALLDAERSIGGRECGALSAAELKAASAILAEYGEAVPVTLRAYTLGQQGKKPEAADLFVSFIDQQMPDAPSCPGEHPMYSHRRTGRISFALKCLNVLAPARDVSVQKKRLQQAVDCAKNNHAVG